jgi:hypothetical protein
MPPGRRSRPPARPRQRREEPRAPLRCNHTVRSIVLIACVAALAAAPQALAKGPLTLCGSSGCAPLGAEGSAGPMIPLSAGTGARLAPVAPAPFYRISFAAHGGTLAYWIPSAHVLRVIEGGLPAWIAPGPDAEALLGGVASTVAPYAAPKTANALVGRRQAAGGSTYLDVYTIGTRTLRWPRTVVWVPINVIDGSLTPWTDGANSLWISRKGGYLRRDGTVAKIPAAVADRIRARVSLR